MAEQDGGSLVYQVDIETAKMVTGSRQAAVVLGEMEKQANRSSKAVDGLTSSADSVGRSMSGFKSVLSGVASAISVALIIDYGKAFLTVADNITQLQSRITRLSTDAATAMSTFETLTAIASTTGASLRDTAKLWEAMTSALKGTGATNTQILALTDTLQKIGRVGGSSTEEMANALRQFGQSISSGTVRAEEFNSILEQMPELARQIGAGMGLSMGQLRQAMLEGKLSAQDALNAIMKQSSAVMRMTRSSLSALRRQSRRQAHVTANTTPSSRVTPLVMNWQPRLSITPKGRLVRLQMPCCTPG